MEIDGPVDADLVTAGTPVVNLQSAEPVAGP
jgi:hypothetical protein